MVATTRAQTNPKAEMEPKAPKAPKAESKKKTMKKKSAVSDSDKAALLPFDMQKRVNELPMDQLAELASLAAKTLKKTTLNRTQTVMKNAAERALKVQTKQAKKQEKVDEALQRKADKAAKKQAKEDEKQARKDAKLALKVAKANPWHEQDCLLPIKTREELEAEKLQIKQSREEEAKQFGFGTQSCFVNHMNRTGEEGVTKNLRPELEKELEEIDAQMDSGVCFDGSTRGFGDKAVFEMAKMCSSSLKRKLEDAMSVIAAEALRKKQLRKSIDNKSYNARRKAKRLAALAKGETQQAQPPLADAQTVEEAPKEAADADAPIIETVLPEETPFHAAGANSPLIQAVELPPTPVEEIQEA